MHVGQDAKRWMQSSNPNNYKKLGSLCGRLKEAFIGSKPSLTAIFNSPNTVLYLFHPVGNAGKLDAVLILIPRKDNDLHIELVCTMANTKLGTPILDALQSWARDNHSTLSIEASSSSLGWWIDRGFHDLPGQNVVGTYFVERQAMESGGGRRATVDPLVLGTRVLNMLKRSDPVFWRNLSLIPLMWRPPRK